MGELFKNPLKRQCDMQLWRCLCALVLPGLGKAGILRPAVWLPRYHQFWNALPSDSPENDSSWYVLQIFRISMDKSNRPKKSKNIMFCILWQVLTSSYPLYLWTILHRLAISSTLAIGFSCRTLRRQTSTAPSWWPGGVAPCAAHSWWVCWRCAKFLGQWVLMNFDVFFHGVVWWRYMKVMLF